MKRIALALAMTACGDGDDRNRIVCSTECLGNAQPDAPPATPRFSFEPGVQCAAEGLAANEVPPAAIGQTSERFMRITHFGSELVNFDALTASAPFQFNEAIYSLGSSDCFFRLMQDRFAWLGYCDALVVFKPTSATSHTGTVVVHGDLGSFTAELPIMGSVVANNAAVMSSQANVFIHRNSYYGRTRTLHIQNVSTAPVALGSPQVTVPFLFDSWDCPDTLMPGSGCYVNVSFNAAAAQPGVCPTGTFTTSTSDVLVKLSAQN
jgi:hypothetical protein